MNLKFAAVTVAVFTLVIPCPARAITPVTPDSNLEKAGSFAMGGIGVAGTMSAGERALRYVLARPDAVARLEAAISNASPAGQLYALLGLRKLDRAAYGRALERLRAIDEIVGTARGCILSRENFRDLVKEIERGGFDDFLARDWPERAR
jgi:hypothetical protein